MKFIVKKILPNCKHHCFILFNVKIIGNLLHKLQKNTAKENSSIRKIYKID